MTKCQRFYYLLILLTTIPDKTDGQTCVCICFICYLLLNIYIGTRMCKLYFSNVYARSAQNKPHRQPAGRLHTAAFFQFLIYKIKRWIHASIFLLLSEQVLDGLRWELSHSGTVWPEIGGEGWREASWWNRPMPGKSLKKVWCWAGPGLASVTVCSRGMAHTQLLPQSLPPYREAGDTIKKFQIYQAPTLREINKNRISQKPEPVTWSIPRSIQNVPIRISS